VCPHIMARFALIVGVALFAACSALPATLPNEEIQHLTEDLSQAKGNLQAMAKTEEKEQKQMADVGSTIQEEPFRGMPEEAAAYTMMYAEGLSFTADAVHTDVDKAISEENDQQAAAVQAMKTVDEAMDTIEHSEKRVLGEDASDTPVEHALAKLKQVSSTLHKGTKTMHTKERLERMLAESEEIAHNTYDEEALEAQQAPAHVQKAQSKPTPAKASAPKKPQQPTVQSHPSPFELGESKDEGAMTALSHAQPAKAVTEDRASSPDEGAMSALSHAQGTAAVTEDHAASPDEGAMSALAHAGSNKAQEPQESLLQKDEKIFKHLLQQEKHVQSAEKASENEMEGLVKKLG